MKRLGHFSGKIYEDNVDVKTIEECCTVIPKEKENDEAYLDLLQSRERIMCMMCPGECGLAKKMNY